MDGDGIKTHGWYEQFGFDERQQKELDFADIYTHGFHHGTDGHNRLLLISKLAETIDKLTVDLNKAQNAP